jgi:hypothetical protein
VTRSRSKVKTVHVIDSETDNDSDADSDTDSDTDSGVGSVNAPLALTVTSEPCDLMDEASAEVPRMVM